MDLSSASPYKVNSAGLMRAGGDRTMCSMATAIEEDLSWGQLGAGVQALAANKQPRAGRQKAEGGQQVDLTGGYGRSPHVRQAVDPLGVEDRS